jgi:hypothetical protein
MSGLELEDRYSNIPTTEEYIHFSLNGAPSASVPRGAEPVGVLLL